MATPSFAATVTTTPPLTVGQLYAPASTPGNVGLCLSGGGTRACLAGMGQLRALAFLTANGSSLLGQVKALSTVSGGSWFGVPYQFLPAAGPSDAAYLGAYNNDQGALTLAELAALPAGNAGNPMTSVLFSIEGLAGTALLVYELYRKTSPDDPLPANLLWQTMMAFNILDPCGLYAFGANGQPEDMFSATTATLAAITRANPSLPAGPAYLFADQADSSRTPRPFLICNLSQLVYVPGTSFPVLAPLQATGFLAGCVGAPAEATDANGLAVGGGGVDPFAFNSTFASLSGATATVTQTRQWALADIMGTSSAFFAAKLADQIAQWEQDPVLFVEWLVDEGEEVLKWIESHLPAELHAEARALVARGRGGAAADFSFPDLEDLIPQYPSWPAGDAAANPAPNSFGDGGSLEDTGVASMLAYGDIDSVIACVNTETPLTQAPLGISDGNGGYLPGTGILVDDSVPPLFGYQPYDTSTGYVPYSAGLQAPENQLYANSQVFASSDFAILLQGLWAAAGSAAPATAPAIFSQSLVVQANPWFGVPARSAAMTIVWVFLNYAGDWGALFDDNPAVQQLVAAEVAKNQFPNYSTYSTQLTATQVNLLANLTSWAMVTADGASQAFSSLFATRSTAK